MKKEYINYLLIVIVLSLCILTFYRVDGFQTSPANLSNFTGEIVAIRIKLTPAFMSQDPSTTTGEDPYQKIGRVLGLSNITKTMENCIGDPIGVSTNSPNSDLVPIFPEFYTALTTQCTTPDNCKIAYDPTKLPIFTLNLKRDPTTPPLTLANQNIDAIFKNMYANLLKVNIQLQSIVLSNNYEYPENTCANLARPILTPNIVVNSTTDITGFTMYGKGSDIHGSFYPMIFNTSPTMIIATINSNGGSTVIYNAATAGNTPPSFSSDVKTYTFSNLIPQTKFCKIYTLINKIAEIPYRNSLFLTGSTGVSDSILQSYYTQELISINMFMSMMNCKLLSIHLSNPDQDISLSTTDDLSLLKKLKTLFFPH